MRRIEADNEDLITTIEMVVEAPSGLYVYVFTDQEPVENLGIIVHDLAQILLSEGQVVIHADFLFEQEIGGSELGPKWE